MLTLDMMQNIELTRVPWGQICTAAAFLMPNYNLPGRQVEITIEDADRIPETGRVILAMNHTDRFNYWPLQYRLWRREESIYTATWVKGKYFNNPIMAKFMAATNNIPTPSRGYLITADAANVLGRPPASETYRLIRDALDAPERDMDALRARARDENILEEFEALLTTPRDMLGRRFQPDREDFFLAMHLLFSAMMDAFVSLNDRAFALGHKVIVFPEGTRSLKLAKGRPGLAQMALKMGATIVPIGCNGSDDIYPGDSPVALPGHVTYRVGEPLTPEGALAEFQLDQDFTPFTQEAERAHGDVFAAVTDLLMARLAELLDERYLAGGEGETTEVKGADRFL